MRVRWPVLAPSMLAHPLASPPYVKADPLRVLLVVVHPGVVRTGFASLRARCPAMAHGRRRRSPSSASGWSTDTRSSIGTRGRPRVGRTAVARPQRLPRAPSLPAAKERHRTAADLG